VNFYTINEGLELSTDYTYMICTRVP